MGDSGAIKKFKENNDRIWKPKKNENDDKDEDEDDDEDEDEDKNEVEHELDEYTVAKQKVTYVRSTYISKRLRKLLETTDLKFYGSAHNIREGINLASFSFK